MGDHRIRCIKMWNLVLLSLFLVNFVQFLDTNLGVHGSVVSDGYTELRFSSQDHRRIRRSAGHDICKRTGCKCEGWPPGRKDKFKINVTCEFTKTEDLIIRHNDLPTITSELRVSGCRRFEVAPHALHSLVHFDLLQVTDAKTVVFRPDAFIIDKTLPSVRTMLHRCGTVTVDKKGLRVNKEGVMHVEMLDVAEVNITENAFEYLQNATFRNISRMILNERSFSNPSHITSHGPTTTIHFQNVFFQQIPSYAFTSPADELHIVSCDIRAILANAFNAALYHSLLLLNSSVGRIESGAFSESAQVKNLTIARSVIHEVEASAIRSAVDRLKFVRNRIDNLRTRAFNMTAGHVLFAGNNITSSCESEVFSLNMWTNITINDNSFYNMRGPLVSLENRHSVPILSFCRNNIHKLDDNSLSFLRPSQDIRIEAKHNYFLEKCSCDLQTWLARKISKTEEIQYDFLHTSYCTIDVILARCLNQPDGNLLVHLYLTKICAPTDNVRCEPSLGNPTIVNGTDELVNPRFPKRRTDEQDDNSDVILWICIPAVIIIIVAITAILAYVTCRNRYNCRSSDNPSTPTSDIVAQMNPQHLTQVATAANDTQPYQETRTEDDGQPLLTNERLADLQQRCESQDEAIRRAACEEVVKLYQTIKRQNNNEQLRADTGLYETIEDAIRRPDLLEVAVAVNDYALPHDVVPGYGARSEYSVPNTEPLSNSIPYMDGVGATMKSDGSGASSGSGRMVNRPLPRTPREWNDK